MIINRLNAYKIMWLFVMFDLPTETKAERKAASDFRKHLLADGFTMFNYSIYVRHCPSTENAEVHIQRTIRNLTDKGHITILDTTDKQFGRMRVFKGKKPSKPITGWQQLELF